MVIAATTETPAVLILDKDGRILSVNPAAAAALGRTAAALANTLLVESLRFELTSSDPEMLAIQWEALASSASIRAQSIRPIDGTRSYHLRLDPITLAAAAWTATLVALPEVSSTAPFPLPGAAAHPLQDALLLIAHRASLGFFDLRLDSAQLVTSNGWKRTLGYAEHELPDTLASWRSLVHPDDTSASPDYAPRRQPAGTRPFSVEYRMRHRAGHYLWINCTGVRVFGPEGALQRVCGVLLDITERKELEEISILNDERLQRLSTQGSLAAFDLDFAQNQHWFSAAWHRLLGTRSHADDTSLPAPTPLLDALPPEVGAADFDSFLRGAPGEGEESRRVVTLLDASRAPLPALLCLQREFGRRDQLSRVIGYAIPLAGLATDPRATPPTLLTAALDALAEAVLITDPHGVVISCNTKAATLLALPAADTLGHPLSEIFQLVHRTTGKPADEAVELALTQPRIGRLDDTHSLSPRTPDAPPRPIVWTAIDARDADQSLAGFVVIFRDPTEMSLTPEELVRANRFESLGILAGGIAHDFNNLLTTILGGVSTAKDNREFNHLDAAEQACLAAKQLTRQLLAFAKGAGTQATRQVVSPADLLQNAVRIAAAGSPVVVNVDTPADLLPVEIDKGQILQVIQNLVINSIQAMPVPADGRITLSAGNITLAEHEFDDLPAGAYVRIDVQDNGTGISPEILPRIFDPFFTTKRSGTGLGLATVDSIVRRHGGRIGVQSSPGAGTLFSVLLPVASRPLQEETRRAPALRFGTGRILLMDDDPKICELTGAMIASLDYTHDIARNGDEAIQLYRRYLAVQRPYDAVLLDLTIIGGMGGEECFKRLRELDPGVHAIVTSGYDDDEMVQRYLDMGFVGYITKPYRVGDLGRVLKSVLTH